MAYGTLITVFAPIATALPLIINSINSLGLPPESFELKESTFFVKLSNIGNYETLVADLRLQGITFTAIFLSDTTGSALRTGNISKLETDQMNQLLCMP